MSTVIDGLIGVDPVLGRIPVRVTGHAGPIRNVTGPQPMDHPLTAFGEVLAIHADVVRDTDVESFLVTLTELAGKYEVAMGKAMVQTLSEVTEAVGNVVDVEGRPLSWDHFLDALEMTESTFDEDGNLEGMRILVHPETAKLLQALEITPEQQLRYDEIIRRKKERWDAQKRPRRLPRKG